MTKQEAELFAQKANERKVDLNRLASYPEYYALKEEIEKMIAKLDTIDSINLESPVAVDVQVVANKHSKKALIGFLQSMGVYSERKIVDSTYE